MPTSPPNHAGAVRIWIRAAMTNPLTFTARERLTF
jgi:hypothetical protein